MEKCPSCGFNLDAKATLITDMTLPVQILSGNYIGGNVRGASGWRYRKYKSEFSKVMPQATVPARVRRRIQITRVFKTPKRAFDRDNLIWGCKPIVDCLVARGWLVDDSPEYVESLILQIPGRVDCTEIKVWDLE